MEEKLYSGFSLEQMQETYPNLKGKKLIGFAEVYDKCSDAFGIVPSLYSIILKDKKCLMGIVRNMNWSMLGCEEIYIDLELRSSNTDVAPQKDYKMPKDKAKRINLFEIDDVVFVRKGI